MLLGEQVLAVFASLLILAFDVQFLVGAEFPADASVLLVLQFLADELLLAVQQAVFLLPDLSFSVYRFDLYSAVECAPILALHSPYQPLPHQVHRHHLHRRP